MHSYVLERSNVIHSFLVQAAQHIQRILGECLLISSLPGKASRTLDDIARLASICVLKAESGTLDTKIHEPGNLFISLPS